MRFLLASTFVCMVSSQLAAQDLVLTSEHRTIAVAPIAPGVMRVRIHPEAETPRDESWSVADEVRKSRVPAKIAGNSIQTPAMIATIDPATLALRITDANGREIFADSDRPVETAGTRFTLNKRLGQDEHIFGMGDKTGSLDRRGSSFVNWNTDTYNFRSGDDPTYKSIPFYISTGGPGGAYGLFLDNSFRSWFDFGHRSPDTISFGAEDGAIDYYVIAGPSVREVVRRFADLTGHTPLPPRWALGYQQSRWSYMNENEVNSLAARLRSERIPTDVIWLDIDYQDRNRPFTVNRTSFPHFGEMVAGLTKMGIRTVAISDLHIARAPGEGYSPYDSGLTGDHFLRNADGTIYVGPVWPGPSVFPDFTRKATRAWWGSQLAGLLDDGVAGIWNDMNEPAIFESPTKTMPLTVQHRIEGPGLATRTTDHREAHNIYGMENTHATYDGLRRLRPDERAFVMTRASFAGGQRFAATWTGDNSSTWDHLRLSVSQTLSLGLSGFAMSGADVGGFTGGPSPSLLTRWYQIAAFAPIFRNHSQKDSPRAEPWVDGQEELAIRRRFVEERYRLMPFLYAVAEASSRTGDPIMRPVFYDYPAVLGSGCDMTMQFTLGGSLLVAGSPKPESPAPYKGCLPAGGWYDYWTGEIVNGAMVPGEALETIDLMPSPETLPLFVRAGTVLPRQPLVQSTSERPSGPLELHVFPGPGCTGEIYDDDGHSFDFLRGRFLRQKVSCEFDDRGLTAVRLEAREGEFPAWWNQILIVIHGSTAYTSAVDGQTSEVTPTSAHNQFIVTDAEQGMAIRLKPLE